MLKSLDFVYIPSKDVDADLKYYVAVLGAEVVFNIREMGTHVAMMKLGKGPRLLLAGHLEGEVPILIYRVENIKKTMKELKGRGWKKGQEVEIPHGPCCTFEASGGLSSGKPLDSENAAHSPRGQRFAIYELARPEADQFLTRGR